MEKIGNDTFKYNGKLYKVVKKEIGHRCNDTCPLYNYRSCGNICSVMYNQLKNPGFTYEDVVLVEVPENENKETNMEEKEPNYKALYEQEHKKYGDAVERMKSWMNGEHPECFSEARKAAEFVFPELKESEDEKIRKELLDYLDARRIVETLTDTKVKEEWIDWLEKQGGQKQNPCENCNHAMLNCGNFPCEEKKGYNGEQKPTDNVEPKFKVGDWVVKGDTITQILDIQEQYYVGLDINGKDFTSSRFLSDDKIHLWTINDAKDGDVLANKNGAIFINAGNTGEDRATLDCYCYLSVQGEFYIEEHKTGSWFYKTEIHPATKEQRDLLFSKMKEAGYEWDAEKKELKKIEQEQTELPKREGLLRAIQILEQSLGEVDGWQSDDGILEHRCAIEAVRRLYEQKATWSKEDEVAWNNTMIMIKECAANHYAQDSINLVVTWLKSLKDRMTWRPTEEQMEALSDAVKLYKSTHFDSHHYKIETLYNDLKKL